MKNGQQAGLPPQSEPKTHKKVVQGEATGMSSH